MGEHSAPMPQKHSKNANSGKIFNRKDFSHARDGGFGSQFGSWHDGWQGTQTQRLGGDSHMPFGFCSLSLQPCVEPVATPSGHLYSREAIFEYLLSKKKELSKQQKAYQAQQDEVVEEKNLQADAAHETDLQNFIDCQEGITDRSASAAPEPVTAVEARKQLEIEMIGGKRDGTSEQLTKKRKQILNSSFWCPSGHSDSVKTAIQKPDKRPRSPMSGNPLRLKDLIHLDIPTDPHVSEVTYLCAVSKKELKHQKIVLIKSTGQVMLKKCFDELAKPDMQCPVTGKTFKDSDVIDLRTGGTGFAAHNAVVAKKYRPSM